MPQDLYNNCVIKLNMELDKVIDKIIDIAETITEIAWNSNNFNELISKLENSGVDKKVVNTIKLWTF